MKRAQIFSVLVPAGALFLGLVACEIGVRVYLHFFPKQFPGLARETAEHFYFANRKPDDPPHPGKDRFDPILGWHPAREAFAPHVKQTLNKMGWRSPHEYVAEKKPGTKRVIVIGDSFTYGWQIDDSETLDRKLEAALGKNHEVWNFSAGGYGVDQMAVLATRIVTRFHPDAIVLGFIGDDLERSCTRFAWGNSLKPYYEIQDGKAVLKGIPVPTPADNAARHEKTRLADRILGSLTKFRVLSVITEPFFRRDLARCLVRLNVAILAHVAANVPPETKVFFAHLDAKLPEGFLEEAKRQGVKVHQMGSGIRDLAAARHEKLAYVDQYHPDARGIELYALLYAELLK